MNTDQAKAVESLIARGVLEQTDRWLTGVIMGNQPEWSSGQQLILLKGISGQKSI